jgi:pimeloyl-ACP methyl ester carboxylesterase
VAADEACWARLPSLLAEDVELRALPLPLERSTRKAAERLLARVEGLPRPRILLGHDRAASVAIELVQFAAPAVDGLILHAPRGARPDRGLWRWLVRGPVLSAEWIHALRPVTVPAALLWGERDRVLPVAGAEAFRPLLTGALVSFPGRWGHAPMLDDPVGYAREICALARKLVREGSPRRAPPAR